MMTHGVRDARPGAWADDALALLRLVTRVLASYTRGVILESIIVGIITGLACLAFGVEAWLPLAAIALAGEIVPIVGSWIAFFVSLLVVLATQPDKAILMLGLFVGVQILKVVFLNPRIQGGSVFFTPVASLLILAFGGVIAGPVGAILALPAAALLRDVSSYTSFRAGGHSPSEALAQLPSFTRGDRAPD